MMDGKGKIDIQHPEAWELLVSIGDRRVDYILYTPSVANSLMMGEVALDDDSLQALEDAVYDLPLLLNEYRRVRIVVQSQHFMLLPVEASDDDCAQLIRQAFPEEDGDVETCVLQRNGAKIACMLPRGMKAFLGRTFNYPDVCHRLLPLCEFFKEEQGGAALSRMLLNLYDDGMDMVIYRDGELQCANCYRFDDVQDAAYFAMNAWRTYGLDQLTDELQLIGDASMRESLTPVLREYVKRVMPAGFPAAAMRLGRNAMQAPLELIQLALCE